MAEVSVGRVRGRPSLGWMYGVMVSFLNRGMTLGCAKVGKSGEPCCICNRMSLTRSFLLGLCSFGPPSRALVVTIWRGVGCRYMMRLGQILKRAQLLNIKAQVSNIWTKGCILVDCVCVI